MKPCRKCGHKFQPRYKTTEIHCSAKCHYDSLKNKPIKPRKRISVFSTKRQKEIPIYKKKRIEFLSDPKNKTCFIEGCKKKANTIEHTRGREGYADDDARDKGITLYLDVRFWKPCCLDHNLELERNGEMSKKYQLSKIHGGKKN